MSDLYMQDDQPTAGDDMGDNSEEKAGAGEEEKEASDEQV